MQARACCGRRRKRIPTRCWKRAGTSMTRATTATGNISGRCRLAAVATIALVAIVLAPDASAHGVSGKDAVFLQSVRGAAVGPLMYLGAKHMVTGYDHLAFLV